MKKIVKMGLSACMAFAFMFAMTLSVVAQDHVDAPTDKASAEFVEAKIFAFTVQKLNTDGFQKKVGNPLSIEVLDKAPKVLSEAWYQYTGPSATDPNFDYEEEVMKPEHYTNIGSTNTAGCVNGTTLCAIKLTDNGEEPDEEELESRQTEILSNMSDSDIAFQTL
ncbi:hypothetical protein [Parapedobacter indicus]|uniref:Uncharacterized protein n=1 Tax=Parapedobacter indicus TaxID=1477437 RepID=A0A1I3TEN9_9SPHI|nr:hypothetical protein [Parapedobacter indicus]PPK99507.1 hypothetical protein CLV26_11225 [Parapedobacter indicus]SFJ69644.1 hypothetical protein SAMN05444682_112156 [Parapedobacter indicus]